MGSPTSAVVAVSLHPDWLVVGITTTMYLADTGVTKVVAFATPTPKVVSDVIRQPVELDCVKRFFALPPSARPAWRVSMTTRLSLIGRP